MTIQIPCGAGSVTLEVSPEVMERVKLWRSQPAKVLSDPAASLEQALASPLGTAPLSTLAQGKKSACVVVSDQTRPVPNRLLLPPLLKTLEAAGLAPSQITILVANGMHDAAAPETMRELYGAEVLERYPVVNHDCRELDQLREVARIEGWPIEINRHYLDADLKILTGLIEPHNFAGFSGGGKSILPGIASLESMRFMHSFNLLDRPEVASANLEGNPFHSYVMQAAGAAGADFVVNVLQDDSRNLIGLFAGELQRVFTAGCDLARKVFVISPSGDADLVVVGSGGNPLDATFYQATKGLITASQAVRPGGNVIWIAGCNRGLGGPEYCAMVSEHCDYASFGAKYADPEAFTLDQWGAQAFFKAKLKPGQVWLCSPGVNYVEARRFGVTKVENLVALFAGLATYCKKIEIIPDGPYLACSPQ